MLWSDSLHAGTPPLKRHSQSHRPLRLRHCIMSDSGDGFRFLCATITTDALLEAISHRLAAPARNARSAFWSDKLTISKQGSRSRVASSRVTLFGLNALVSRTARMFLRPDYADLCAPRDGCRSSSARV